jgi:hypothetical protein
MKNEGSMPGEEVTSSSSSMELQRSMNVSLVAVRDQLSLEDQVVSSLNQSLLHLGQNTTARLDWLNRDMAVLQVGLYTVV